MAEFDIPRGPIEGYPSNAIRYERGEEAIKGACVQALLQALDGVELGDHDRSVLDWLAGWETGTVATVCSWLYRVREAAAPILAARDASTLEHEALFKHEEAEALGSSLTAVRLAGHAEGLAHAARIVRQNGAVHDAR